VSDKKTVMYDLGTAIRQVVDRGTPSGLAGELHAELARDWPLRERETSFGSSLYVPFGAFARRDMQASLPNLGSEWLGKKDLLAAADLLATSSVVAKAGAIVATGLQGNTTVPATTALPTPLFVPETGAAPVTDLTTGQSGPLVPRRLSGQVLVSRQLVVQGGLMLETLLKNDLTRSFAMTADAMALFGRGAAFDEPMGVLANPGSVVQPIAGTDYYGAMMLARETVGLTGVDMEQFGFIVGPSVERALRLAPKFAVGGDTDTWTAAAPIYSSPRVSVARCFFGSWSNIVFGVFGTGILLQFDPFTFCDSGRILVTGNIFMDTAIRMAGAFGYTDIITTTFAERNGTRKANQK
jgi:Phage capsid family